MMNSMKEKRSMDDYKRELEAKKAAVKTEAETACVLEGK